MKLWRRRPEPAPQTPPGADRARELLRPVLPLSGLSWQDWLRESAERQRRQMEERK